MSEFMKIDSRHKTFLLLLLCLLAIAIWAQPIWYTPGMRGINDWDPTMHRFEALRQTIVTYHQWPGHNPWIMGGVPLLGYPSFTILSIKGLLILLFGTYWGLRLGVLVYLFILFIGAWKLSSIWWEGRFIRLIFSFYATANSALIYHVAGGHLLFQSFCFIPLAFYFLLRFNQDKWSGLKAAIVLGAAFNDSFIYMVQYGLLIVVCVYLYFLISNYKENSRALMRWIAIFTPVFLALIFYRAITFWQIAVDYPRLSGWRAHYQWIEVLKYYLFPYTKFQTAASCQLCATTPEVCSYIGIVAFIFTLISFRKGLKWWHGMMILLVWAGIGNDSYFHIMRWIQKIPTFSSHVCFARIRVVTLLFFAIAAVSGLSYVWEKCKDHEFRFLRYIVFGFGVLMTVEVLLVSYLVMRSSHIKSTAAFTDGTAHKFQNIGSLPQPVGSPGTLLFTYDAIRMNLGWLRGYGESYIVGEDTIRVGRDEPGYKGEFVQNGRAVDPVFWSPNRILLKGLDPSAAVIINMNPGRPWYGNGKQLFPNYRIVELEKPFNVMPDEKGVVELIYRYPGQLFGILGTLFWSIVSLFVVVLYRNRSKQLTSAKACY